MNLRILVLLFCLPWAGAYASLRVASLSTVTSDIARQVGGDRVQVIAIVKAGMDPHEFHPTPGDVKRISGADLVLYTGKGIEGYLSKLEEAVGGYGKFVDVGRKIPASKWMENGREVEDPHWWNSVANLISAAQVVRDAFVKADPENASIYQANATRFFARLDALQLWVEARVAELPRDQRKLVTSHDAFQYFAKAFGFTIYFVKGGATDEQPSSKHVVELERIIRQERVKAIFFENIENPKVLAQICRETGVKIGGKLYADGLGEDAETNTCESMIRYNVNTIVQGLKSLPNK